MAAVTQTHGGDTRADRDRDPQHDVEKHRRASYEREHDERETHESRVNVEVLRESAAHTGDDFVAGAAVQAGLRG